MDSIPDHYDDSPYFKEYPTNRNQFDDASEDDDNEDDDDDDEQEDPPPDLLRTMPPPEHCRQAASSRAPPQELFGPSVTTVSASMGALTAQSVLVKAGRRAEVVASQSSIRDGDNLLLHMIPDVGPHDILCGPDVGVFPNAG